MTEQNVQTVSQKAQQLAGKYLSFTLASQEYALGALEVAEIIGLQDITTVPRAPSFIKGVINLRGKVIPVLDLRLKLGLPEEKYTSLAAIIITRNAEADVGLLVDAVSDVLEIAGEEIEEVPSFSSQIDTSYILALAKTNDRVTILLDLAGIIKTTGLSIDQTSPQ